MKKLIIFALLVSAAYAGDVKFCRVLYQTDEGLFSQCEKILAYEDTVWGEPIQDSWDQYDLETYLKYWPERIIGVDTIASNISRAIDPAYRATLNMPEIKKRKYVDLKILTKSENGDSILFPEAEYYRKAILIYEEIVK